MKKRTKLGVPAMAAILLSFFVLTGCNGREEQFLMESHFQEEAVGGEEKAGEEITDSSQSQDEAQAEEIREKEERQPSDIYVDVCGAVVSPGVFQLAQGSRVFQAIEAAGGFLPEAAQSCVNRAGILTDGQQIYILTQEEMEQQERSPAQENLSGGQTAAEGTQDGKVNLNTADESQLMTLNGIGATRAQAIIAYREENGPFLAIEEIMNVQGIKEGTFTKIKEDIIVG